MRRLYSLVRLVPRRWRHIATAGMVGVCIGWSTSPLVQYDQNNNLSSMLDQSAAVIPPPSTEHHPAAQFGIPS